MTIKKDRWYFITPLFDIARANITAEGIHNIAIREYDAANRATNGTGDNWRNIGNNDLKAGHGYIIRSGEDGTLTFTGNQTAATNVMKTGVRSVALNNHESTSVSDSHWNYIGNPYPCYFDIRFLEVGAPITIRNDNSDRYEALSTIDDSYVLNPMEGFFVQKRWKTLQELFSLLAAG